ncbi:tryptophan 2,3-dioxygenase family protein [Salinispirillum sp. LH 10-3-1]|uniref:Tryptophan 2,3-dioxygenase n=1 Tax=Salinispirillum sp. LH 10-3-1 TaxID=2952525 RepID=A0AB38YJX0_9GAMM
MLTYSSYLKVDELLSLQQPESKPVEHDETLFIIIHQTYELWFKQLLHEIDFCNRLMADGDTARAAHTLQRILKIMKTLVGQVDILETMTPLEFASFRTFLASSSGFQSYQFRAFEFALGYKRLDPLKHQPKNSPAAQQLNERLAQPSVWQHLLMLLARRGYNIPDEALVVCNAATEPNESVQAVLLEVYHQVPDLTLILELLVDLDEGLQEWRYRHVQMVRRTIGSKMGSGGSEGVGYLQTTLFKPVFPDLWAIRAQF